MCEIELFELSDIAARGMKGQDMMVVLLDCSRCCIGLSLLATIASLTPPTSLSLQVSFVSARQAQRLIPTCYSRACC